MIETVIGGHRGLTVYRSECGIVLRITEETLVDELPETLDLFRVGNRTGIHNYARLLRVLAGSGIAPELIEEGDDFIVVEDLGESEPVTDYQEFRFNAIRLLLTLRDRRVRHGDLTDVNIIVKNNQPLAIDFAQSSLFDEEKVDKRPASDSWWLWVFVKGSPDSEAERDPSRSVRRWLAIQEAAGAKIWAPPAGSCVGKTLLDLGCFQGEMTAMAAADGFVAHGVDYGGFRSGEDSIEIARQRWGKWCTFQRANILDLEDFEYNVVLLLSTWPYIVETAGWDAAVGLLRRILSQCGLLYFETQLYGDGPGPILLRNETDVSRLLSGLGEARPIVSLTVQGRDAIRTTWEVKGRGPI